MSWLDDMAKNLKTENCAAETEKKYSLTGNKDELVVLLRKEYENATENEILRALSYAEDKTEAEKISYNELLKIVRCRLED